MTFEDETHVIKINKLKEQVNISDNILFTLLKALKYRAEQLTNLVIKLDHFAEQSL